VIWPELSRHRHALTSPTRYLLELLIAILINFNVFKTPLLEWYFKIITIQPPPSCLNFTGLNKRINFKTATLAYQSLAFGQPTYLSSVLTPHQPQRSLCSVNQNLLFVPRYNSSFGQRSFSYCAPKIWNDIPLLVRQSPSLDSFKHNLKTHYFANN